MRFSPAPAAAGARGQAGRSWKGGRAGRVLAAQALLAIALSACGQAAATTPTAAVPAAAAPTAVPAADSGGIQTFTNLSRDHVDGPITYPQVPPVGGAHNPVWMNCGIYDKPIPNENAVHSLEHGAVWITYLPDLPDAAVEQLRGLVRGHDHVLLSPYPGLPAPVVASAWGVQLRASGADDPRLAKFVATYENGPQTPEPGAVCSGAKGVPLVK